MGGGKNSMQNNYIPIQELHKNIVLNTKTFLMFSLKLVPGNKCNEKIRSHTSFLDSLLWYTANR